MIELVQLRYTAERILRGTTAEEWAVAGKPVVGTCTVCAARGVQFRDFSDNLRETGACPCCEASNRQRQMAFALRRVLNLPPHTRLMLPQACRLYNAEARGPLHSALAQSPGYICSEFWGETHAPGSVVNGIRHENLEQLSFSDASLDIVLTSDVLEHVADPYRAHREIRRVLRNNGAHIFTVPFRPEAAHDELRAHRVGDAIEYLAEPIYHGDPLRPEHGTLVWRIFGKSMLQRLADIGFATRMVRARAVRYGILGDNALVFVARKVATE